ncbi:hypothetical protein ACROYT_G044481 [Oculina patagonica]
MARITLVFLMLSSVFGIDAGMRHEPQVHNVTHLEKRSPMIKAEEQFPGCSKASYSTVTLYDFVYKHNCFPQKWREFFHLAGVSNEIKTKITPELSKMIPIEPPMPDMFKVLHKISPQNVKVIILGQDPTPQQNQATGMAFSLKPGVDPRDVPSVFNMLVELKWEGIDVGLSNGDLTPWVGQGVLLLNAALTVRRGPVAVQAGSHQKLWAGFTSHLVKYINDESPPSAWLLWGAKAQEFANLIKRPEHMIKAGAHPRARTGFFGRNYFQCANEFLGKKNRGQIDWRLQEKPESFAEYIKGCDAEGIGE